MSTYLLSTYASVLRGIGGHPNKRKTTRPGTGLDGWFLHYGVPYALLAIICYPLTRKGASQHLGE